MFLKRGAARSKKGKTPKIVQYNRDIICLPSSYGDEGSVSIPRGKQRTLLAKLGLQGKITLSSDMNEEAIRDEIRSAFVKAMGDDPSFLYTLANVRLWWEVPINTFSLSLIPVECTGGVQARKIMHLHFGREKTSN